jgi:hypothetical protein
MHSREFLGEVIIRLVARVIHPWAIANFRSGDLSGSPIESTTTTTMKTTTTLAALALAATLSSTNATPIIDLFEYGVNIDGAVSNNSAPAGVNISGFDTGTGLGTILMALSGAGPHYCSLFVDHEIDESINTFFNEFGTAAGAPVAGQSWEIDEPGYVFGDIYTNFVAGTLDNSNGVSPNSPDDVSMALGWNVTLASWESATAYFTLSETAPTSGFYLKHFDPDSGGAVYFSSALNVTGSPGGGVPDGGSTLALLLCACGGLAGWRSLRQSFL